MKHGLYLERKFKRIESVAEMPEYVALLKQLVNEPIDQNDIGAGELKHLSALENMGLTYREEGIYRISPFGIVIAEDFQKNEVRQSPIL